MDVESVKKLSVETSLTEEEIYKYLEQHEIRSTLTALVKTLCIHKPDEPIQFMVEYLQKLPSKKQAEESVRAEKEKERHEDEDVNMDDSQDSSDAKGDADAKPQYSTRRRGAFSSEPVAEVEKFEPEQAPIPKNEVSQAKIEKALQSNILSSHLDENERKEVSEAMYEQHFEPGDVIIQQGDDGDVFYIVDTGECDIYVEKDGEKKKHVLHVTQGGSFGELALIYNTPRAATVVATTKVVCFCINRITYRRILMDATMRKRALYEGFLDRVPILASLEKYERLTVADALEPENFEEGQTIVKQGDPGDVFYIIVEGNALVTKTSDGKSETVGELGPSDYFGEIALLTNRPRAATVTAKSTLKCVRLDRDRFNRVLGPCEDILRRNMNAYQQYIATQI